MAASSEEIRKHLKTYYRVFAGLAVLTVVTVAASHLGLSLDFPIAAAVAMAMVIAIVKGSLVASFFMHLVSERKLIFWILGLCAVLFLALLLLPSLTTYEPDLIKRVHGVSGG